jgi:hypothetical protein
MTSLGDNFDKELCVKHNLKGLAKEKELRSMPFGRYIEQNKIVKEFKAAEDTKTSHISIKRKTVAAAFREFKELNNVDKFYAQFHNGRYVKDDSFAVHYTEKVGQ